MDPSVLQGSRGAPPQVQLLREEGQEQEGAHSTRVRAHGGAALPVRRVQQRLQEQLRTLHAQDACAQDCQARHKTQLREEGAEEEGFLDSQNSALMVLQIFMITRSCLFGDSFYWKQLPEYTTCLGLMAAVVLPSSSMENQNQISLLNEWSKARPPCT